ncbi:serine/threonine-protein kinase Pink1, mitochondrial-like [Tachypleus tridentatus]|uniref:serine/threonine-protein kinase Pink1, mitochondrial-like n=1 Tax=Tachypleus tridentatus TaxID=6853 RepID=UPI003FD0CBEB
MKLSKNIFSSLLAQQARDGIYTQPSFRSVVDRALAQGRLLLRCCIGRAKAKKCYEPNSLFSETLEKSISNKLGVLQNTNRNQWKGLWTKYFKCEGFVKRFLDNCVSNSLAAQLRRNAARWHMTQVRDAVPFVAFVGLGLVKGSTLLSEQEELESVCLEIRDVFSHFPCTVTNSKIDVELPEVTVENLKIGNAIAKGCNAVVYSADWKSEMNDCELGSSPEMGTKINCEELSEESVYTGEAGHPPSDLASLIPVGKFEKFKLAVKMMFNYDAESDAGTILNAMYKESLPAWMGCVGKKKSFLRKRRRAKRLDPHPNIVEMYLAFADWVPLMPQAKLLYPQALPVRLNSEGYGRNMTLFLVMKRYHCSLRDLLKAKNLDYRTSLMIFTQILEGVTHLLRHEVAHRDLKSDNILVDLSYGFSQPLVAITDFGCCLSDGLKLPFHTEDINRGGNLALMAPEVLAAEPGPFSSINFSRSDVWTVGTLAYEIFGKKNPFYRDSPVYLDNFTYTDNELPPLPPEVHVVLQKLVKDLLKRDPDKRPSPSFAATICQLLLLAPSSWFSNPPSHQIVLNWLVSVAAFTMCQSRVFKDHELLKVNPVEWTLQATFLCRVHLEEVMQAIAYITQLCVE